MPPPNKFVVASAMPILIEAHVDAEAELNTLAEYNGLSGKLILRLITLLTVLRLLSPPRYHSRCASVTRPPTFAPPYRHTPSKAIQPTTPQRSHYSSPPPKTAPQASRRVYLCSPFCLRLLREAKEGKGM